MRPKYLFGALIDTLALEWLDGSLPIGNIASLGGELVVSQLNSWVVNATGFQMSEQMHINCEHVGEQGFEVDKTS